MAEYSICKCIRTDKPLKSNGKYPIYLRVKVAFKGSKFPTNIDVNKSEWDKKKKEPKDNTLRILLNKKVEELELYINRVLIEGQELNIDVIRDFYSGKRKIRPESRSFFDYYLEFVERKRKEGINPETIRVYMTTFNVLMKFKNDIKISDISLSLIEEFDNYMREVNNNSDGGRNPKHKNLRTVILDIEKRKIPIDNPYKWFKIPTPSVKEVFLSKTELNTLIDYVDKFDNNSKEYRILKMYLFSCFCGLRFSDVMTLRWIEIDFENNLICKKMIKTKLEVIAPLFPMAWKILNEISKAGTLIGSDENIFYNYSEPTVNKTIRKEAVLAGINKHLTYHSSRHTFATLLVLDSVDIYKISKYLGHSSVSMTNRYLKYDLSIAKESIKGITTFSS